MTDELRFAYYEKIGQVVGLHLMITAFTEHWWRWTGILGLAIYMENSMLMKVDRR